jgi:hypothetical protein
MVYGYRESRRGYTNDRRIDTINTGGVTLIIAKWSMNIANPGGVSLVLMLNGRLNSKHNKGALNSTLAFLLLV